MVPKTYIVFNIARSENIEFPAFEAELRSEAEKIQACEDVVANMPNKPSEKGYQLWGSVLQGVLDLK